MTRQRGYILHQDAEGMNRYIARSTWINQCLTFIAAYCTWISMALCMGCFTSFAYLSLLPLDPSSLMWNAQIVLLGIALFGWIVPVSLMNLSRFLSVELKQEAPFAKFDGVMPQRVRVDQRTGRAILNACLHEASSEDRRQIEQLAGTLRHTKYEKASQKHRAAMREQMRQERRRAAKAERLRGRQ